MTRRTTPLLRLAVLVLVAVAATGCGLGPALRVDRDLDADDVPRAVEFLLDEHLLGAGVTPAEAIAAGYAHWVEDLRTAGRVSAEWGAELAQTDAAVVEADLRGGAEDLLDDFRTRLAEATREPRLAAHAARDRLLSHVYAAMDPHTTWYPRPEWRRRMESMTGRYHGIGVSVVASADGPVVIEVFDSGPSAGRLQPGDVITAVDGIATGDRDLRDVTRDMRGRSGTDVELTVRRGDEVLTVTVRRGPVEMPDVRTWTVRARDSDDFVLVADLDDFRVGVTRKVRRALEGCADRPGFRGLVLDLRGNPGGDLDETVALVDALVDRGPVTLELSRSGIKTHSARRGGSAFGDGRQVVVVLVDRFSASASELTAGALQDHGVGLVLGERTHGKGTVQRIYPVGGDRGAVITRARFHLPSGRTTQLQGVQPDWEMSDPRAQALADLVGPDVLRRERDYTNPVPPETALEGPLEADRSALLAGLDAFRADPPARSLAADPPADDPVLRTALDLLLGDALDTAAAGR